MQFHLNGFRPGDPRIHDAAPQALAHGDALPSEVDVLIVANPCFGLDFASVAEIRAQIMDQRNRGAPFC